MGAGQSMEARKRGVTPKPILEGHHWTDEDFSPWQFGDYDICEQSEAVQTMLELASMLSDARREWALAAARQAQTDMNGPKFHEYREPRHAQRITNHRRGFDARKE